MIVARGVVFLLANVLVISTDLFYLLVLLRFCDGPEVGQDGRETSFPAPEKGGSEGAREPNTNM